MEDDESKQFEEAKLSDGSPISAKALKSVPEKKMTFLKKFQLQKLAGEHISPSPNCMICWNFACFLLLFIFGLILIVVTSNVNEVNENIQINIINFIHITQLLDLLFFPFLFIFFIDYQRLPIGMQ